MYRTPGKSGAGSNMNQTELYTCNGFRARFNPEKEKHDHGTQRWIETGIGKSSTCPALFTPDEHKTRVGTFTGISFASDDVMATWKELAAKGVEFVKEPVQQYWGTSAVFKAQDGNQFVLSSA